MSFEVLTLGSSSAIPAYQRHPAAHVLNIHGRFFLLDCGEGTQMQLMRYNVKYHRINHIFISHLHGDHYLGLMGLLSTLHLQGRKAALHLYGPAELKEILDVQLRYSEATLSYPLIFQPLQYAEKEVIYEDQELIVSSFPLRHRIPCAGFLFAEKKRAGKLIPEKIKEFDIPVTELQKIKDGNDFTTSQGQIVSNKELIIPSVNPRSFAYCSDTIYDEQLAAHFINVDMLYHEATFLHELAGRAAETYHTTSLQAGLIARKAAVKQLLIGHFSARYKQIEALVAEARTVFPETIPAVEGQTISIGGGGSRVVFSIK